MAAIDPAYALLGGRYRLQTIIGDGGTASVYQARDEFLGRDVAVKMFRSSASAEKSFKQQEDEVNVLASLSHPGLVTLLDAAIDKSDPDKHRIYYVMELVEGVDLRRRLKAGTLPPRQVAQIAHDLADGLEYVHARGIVHRDIKPANVLLSDFSVTGGRIHAKLSDFGIALRGESGELEEDGTVTGTVAYLSPEQARGDAITTASDVYSLGLVLLQCFTGRLAFEGTPLESSAARLARDPEIPADVPAIWRDLIRAMTERDPLDRPAIHDLSIAFLEAIQYGSGRHKGVDVPILSVEEGERLAEV